MRQMAGELARIMSRHDAARAELDDDTRRWQADLERGMAAVEAREAESRQADRDDVPADAPREFERVMVRVQRGELEWFDVVAGATDDPDAYVVHRWLSRRLDEVRDVVRGLMADEHPAEEHPGEEHPGDEHPGEARAGEERAPAAGPVRDRAGP